MPYRNIVWIKLKLELLSDYRFTDKLNDTEKLLFIALLLLAGDTDNNIPHDSAYIKRRMNLNMDNKMIEKSLIKIAEIYPKTLINNGVIQFEKFEKLHNFTVRNSKGTPKDYQRNSKGCAREEKSRVDKENNTMSTSQPEVDLISNNNITNKGDFSIMHKVLSEWNGRMPWKVRSITGQRKKHLLKRLKEKDFIDNYHTILTKILNNSFLNGSQPTKSHPNFKADFDWIIKNDTNYIKILEDKYAAGRGEQ